MSKAVYTSNITLFLHRLNDEAFTFKFPCVHSYKDNTKEQVIVKDVLQAMGIQRGKYLPMKKLCRITVDKKNVTFQLRDENAKLIEYFEKHQYRYEYEFEFELNKYSSEEQEAKFAFTTILKDKYKIEGSNYWLKLGRIAVINMGVEKFI